MLALFPGIFQYHDPMPSNALCLRYFLVSSNITTQCLKCFMFALFPGIFLYHDPNANNFLLECQQITFLLNAKDRMNPQQSWVPPGPHCSRVCNLVARRAYCVGEPQVRMCVRPTVRACVRATFFWTIFGAPKRRYHSGNAPKRVPKMVHFCTYSNLGE